LTRRFDRAITVIAAACAAILLMGVGIRAQDFASAPPSEPPPPPSSFVMPDVQDSWMEWSRYNGRLFSARLSFVPIVDYNAFVQDSDSVKQVGAQENQWDIRTFRIMTRGQLKFGVPIDYFVSLEVKGSDHLLGTEVSRIGWSDLYLAVPIPKFGTVTFGKIKEPWVYEMVGDAANLPQEERILNPFFVSRNIGVRVSNTFAHKRATWAAGWFNDWWVQDEKFDESGNQVSGRVTALPMLSADGAQYLHVGGSLRYTGSEEGTLRFRGRPESNVSSYYVDTGDIIAAHANEFGLETLWNRGPLSTGAEYVHAAVDAPANGNPAFSGGYVTVSYVLTGEHRPYDPNVGYARRVMPLERGGAWEVFARYSRLNLAAPGIDGGILDKGTVGLTWWATRHWRFGCDYGVSDLQRFDAHGVTQSLHPRFQWVY
jgi:phosphate-selective porin